MCHFKCIFFSEETYVAIGSFSHLFVILNANGDKILQLSLPDNIQSMALFSEKYSLIFVGCFDGCLYCIDFMTKQIIWKFVTANSIVSSPRFLQNKSAIVFGSYDENLYCLKIEVSFQKGNVNQIIVVCTVNDEKKSQ